MNPTLKDGHNAFYVLNILGFLFSMALALPLYVNSTFITEHLTRIFGDAVADKAVGIIYVASSFVTLIALLLVPRLLNRFGNYKTTSVLLIINVFLMFALGWLDSIFIIVPAFIFYLAILSVLFFNFDVFLENYSSDANTGSIRGMFLTMLNIAILISPAIAGFILVDNNYWTLYSLGAFFMFVVFILLTLHFNDFKDPEYERIPFWSTFKELFANKNLYGIFMANVLLRFFYAWMVIYMPIYLHQHVGFEWHSIGIIFTIMLLPFVLFELPAGRLADTKWGEKEILTFGFFITGISTIALVLIHQPVFWIWAVALFITRIGASLIEITTESYFFKHVDGADANLIGFFRNTRPIAYIVAPAIASILLSVESFEYKYLFLVLGLVMFLGIRYSISLRDTR